MEGLELVLLAGEIAAGKSTIASFLSAETGCGIVHVRDALRKTVGLETMNRTALQQAGADLDLATSGHWLLDYLVERTSAGGRWVVDSVRTPRQTRVVLGNIPGSKLVYIVASPEARRQRYSTGRETDPMKRASPLDRAMDHPTERAVRKLRQMADLVVQSDKTTASDLSRVIQTWLGWAA